MAPFEQVTTCFFPCASGCASDPYDVMSGQGHESKLLWSLSEGKRWSVKRKIDWGTRPARPFGNWIWVWRSVCHWPLCSRDTYKFIQRNITTPMRPTSSPPPARSPYQSPRIIILISRRTKSALCLGIRNTVMGWDPPAFGSSRVACSSKISISMIHLQRYDNFGECLV